LRLGIGAVWHTGDGIPWTLLLINLVGSFAIGVVGVLWGGHRGWWPLLGPGLLGGFTTFSAIAAMTWTTSAGAAASLAVLSVTLVACGLAAKAGLELATWWRERS
jgi:CrcB protein